MGPAPEPIGSNRVWFEERGQLSPVNADLPLNEDSRLAASSSFHRLDVPSALALQEITRAHGVQSILIHEARTPLTEILALVRQILDTDLQPLARRNLNSVISITDALLKRLTEAQVTDCGGTFLAVKSTGQPVNTEVASLIDGQFGHEVGESLPDREPSRPVFLEAAPHLDEIPILAETAGMFCDSAPLLHRKLCDAAAAGNLDLVQFTASSLKGSIAVLRGVRGAAECHRKVQEIEEFAALELLEQVQELAPLLEPYFGLLLHHLDEIIHPPHHS